MNDLGLIGTLLIGVNLIISYKGLKDLSFFEKYKFNIDGILVHKEYRRLLTSGFLHVSWTHFIFNMLTLYFFSDSLERSLGVEYFILIYFASLIGGNLLSLFIHRNHGKYSAVGASGAISGIIFTSIAIYPGMELSLILLPIKFPGWAFGLFYVLYSIYGIKSQRDNIGHEAHLGGGITGLITVIALFPVVVSHNPIPIALMAVPSAIFFIMLIRNPSMLIISYSFGKKGGYKTVDDKYHEKKHEQQLEIDRILDKINKVGVENLTQEEKEKLGKF